MILDKNDAIDIVQDVSNFLENRDWYLQRGVPFRRGYLLFGPPGTGKTSFILALAGKLQMGICCLNLSGSNLDDDRLIKLFENIPARSLILIEDVDSVFVERDTVKKQSEGRAVSFSGLLNALDGVRSTEGRVLFMTTNHKEKLDPAMLRPGRADVHLKLDYASESQMYRLFKKFYPSVMDEKAKEFSFRLPEYQLPMAKLQGHLLRFKDRPEEAIASSADLLEIDRLQEEMDITDWLFRAGLEQHAHLFLA